MKPKLLLSALFSFFFYLLSSQIPQGFNYQAIARDGSGNPIVGATIKVKLSILSDTLGFRAGGGTYVWEEEHINVLTNAYGLFNIVLGDPGATKVQGVASFSVIDWNQPKLFIGTKIANPSTYKVLGGAKLWSVPYSLVAGELGGTVDKIKVKGTEVEPDSALFEVKNKNGQIVFAVYNEGVRVYVDDGIKGNTKGGFAIGGFGTDKGTSQNYLMVSRDSIRAYVNDTIAKGVTKGGFAIGGFGTAKSKPQDYFRVTRDSTRVNVFDDGTKGITKGGFAIGGFDNSKGAVTPFTSLTQDNYFIGHQSGSNILNSARFNSTLGYQSGILLTSGVKNSFFGYKSGYSNTTGSSNLFLGVEAGYYNSTGSFNSFMGIEAGKLNSSGIGNTFAGSYAGTTNTTGNYNSFVGYEAGRNNDSGTKNVFLGYQAGLNNFEGSNNIFIGNQSGLTNAYGSNNIFLGISSGRDNLGNDNVFIGSYAGLLNSLGRDNVFIGTSAGSQNTTGVSNLFLGTDAGHSNTTGHRGVFLGASAGGSNTTGQSNVFIGTRSGLGNIYGESNVFIGENSGQSNTGLVDDQVAGSWNIFVGFESGAWNTTGGLNTFLGYQSGLSNTTGDENLFLGYFAGYANTTGSRNVHLGFMAGYEASATGSNNVFLGSQAGYSATGSNKLYIANTATNPSNTLIYGEFDSKILAFDAKVGIGTITPSQKLDVEGTIRANYLSIDPQDAGSEGGELFLSGAGVNPGVAIDNLAGNVRMHTFSSGKYLQLIGGTIRAEGTGGSNYFAGNVGIGTTAPSTKLHVSPGQITLNGTTNPYVTLNNNFYQGNVEISSSSIMGLTYNGPMRLSITTNGMVGIGRTPSGNKLEVEGNASKTVAGSWLANSDERIKRDIREIGNAFETILNLHPVMFKYNDEYKKNHEGIEDKYYYNFIAQEYQQVFPESVKGSGEFIEGNNSEILQMDSYNAQIVTIKAVQELIIENRKQTEEIENLKAELEQIKAMLMKGGMK